MKLGIRIWVSIIALITVAIVAIGCGGGGGGSTPTGPTSNQVSVFVTDDLSTTLDHVWVTITKITLASASGSTTIYDNPTGKQIDVAQLHNGSASVFAFLGVSSIPAGTYTGASVTLLKDITVVKKGGTVTENRTFKNLDPSGNKIFTLTFSPAKTVAAGSSLVFDFNLAKWNDDGANVDGEVDDHDGKGLENESNHAKNTAKGTVSNVSGTAPVLTFTLTPKEGSPFTVSTSASTNLTNSDGSANPAIAEGEKVLVHGTFNTTLGQFVADGVQIQLGTDANPPVHAEGTLSGTPTGTTSFSLLVKDADGFTPAATTLTVNVTDTTKLFGPGGLALSATDFFTALATSTEVNVEGSYDSASNTLTATCIRLEGHANEDHKAKVAGAPSGISATAGTFQITAKELDGIFLPNGAVVNVTTQATTEFVKVDGTDYADAASFFADLATATRVSAEGSVNVATKTITADRIRIQGSNSGGGGGGGDDKHPAVHVGGVLSGTATATGFQLKVQGWKEGDFHRGQVVVVNLTNTTKFGLDRQPSDGATVVAALATAAEIQVEGTVASDGSITALGVNANTKPTGPGDGGGGGPHN